MSLDDPNFDEKEIFLKFLCTFNSSNPPEESYTWFYNYQLCDFVAVELLGDTIFWNNISDQVNIVTNALLIAWIKNNWIRLDEKNKIVRFVEGHPVI